MALGIASVPAASVPAAPRAAAAPRAGWLPPLGMVLLGVNLVVLALPVAGVAAFRLYETELVLALEADLGNQAALVASAYRQRLMEELSACAEGPGYGAPVPAAPASTPFEPFAPRIDLATEPVLPPAADPEPAATEPHAAALAAGAWLSEVLKGAQARTLAGYRVVDPAGVVVATSREELATSLARREEVARALLGETTSLLRERVTEHDAPLRSISRATRVRMFVAMPVRDGDRLLGAVVVSRTPVSLGKALHERWGLLAAGAIAVLLAASAVAAATTLLVGRPLSALARATEDIRRRGGGVVPLLRHPRTRETAQLSRAFHELSQSLASRSLAARSFASAVSHELKNPLGAIRGSVELLRDHHATMSPGERERFLANIDADAARMVHLVTGILELARAEAPPPAEATADVAAAIEGPCERHGARLEVRGGRPRVRMAPEVLATVVTVLLENAREHGGPSAAVDVRVASGGGAVAIDVADDGPGIAEADRARVLQPFYTTARERGGTGLGLAIASALAAAHGGRLDLVPSDRGARFRLTLLAPRA